MASIINAALSGGLVTSADTSGVLQLQTASITAVTITASQNVGIGTTTPTFGNFAAASSGLEVKSANTYGVLRIGGATGEFYLASGGSSSAWLWNTSNAPLIFGTNNAERMRIDASGNLGIGTSSPATKLDVNGGVTSTAVTIKTTANTGLIFNDTVADRWQFVNRNDASDILQIVSGNINSGGTSIAELTSAGFAFTNIGLGLTTPTTSGTGITFPATQSASSNANTLDDYEEGTFTPTATGVTVNSGTPVWSSTYTKIGRTVVFTWQLTGGANVTIAVGNSLSLPFSATDVAWGGYGNNSSSAFIGGLQAVAGVVYFGTASTLVAGGGTVVFQV